MEGIRSNVAVQTQQSNKGKKALKQAGNVMLTGAGLGAVKLAFDTTGYIWNYSQITPEATKTIKLRRGVIGTIKSMFNTPNKIAVAKKIRHAFENLGEKLFKHPKIHQLFVNYEKLGSHVPSNSSIRFNKGVAAVLLSLGVAALGILTAGIYKAGKINGEN